MPQDVLTFEEYEKGLREASQIDRILGDGISPFKNTPIEEIRKMYSEYITSLFEEQETMIITEMDLKMLKEELRLKKLGFIVQ